MQIERRFYFKRYNFNSINRSNKKICYHCYSKLSLKKSFPSKLNKKLFGFLSRREHIVSVYWQMFFSIIPIIDLWAAYRIGKTWTWFWIFIVFINAFIIAWSISHQPLILVIYIVLRIFLIRRWSIQWNKKFDRIINAKI